MHIKSASLLAFTALSVAIFCSSTSIAEESNVSEGRVNVGSGAIYYRVSGTGEPIVLLHGFNNVGAVWDPFLTELSKKFQIFIFDLPGHGKSDRIDQNFSHPVAAGHFASALKKMGLVKVKAVGHSSGGMILLHMSLFEPGLLKSMVLASTSPRIPEKVRHMSNQFSYETLPPKMLEALRRWHPGGESQIRWLVAQQKRLMLDPTDMNLTADDLRRIVTKTLIVHGDKDDLLPMEMALEMRSNIPNSSLLVLPGARHEFIFDPGIPSRLFEQTMLEFLLSE